MVKLLWYLRGYWAVEITGAAPEWMLNRLSSARIPFWNLRRPDAFTLQLCIFPRDLTAVEHLAEKAMCRVEQSRQMGFFAAGRRCSAQAGPADPSDFVTGNDRICPEFSPVLQRQRQ